MIASPPQKTKYRDGTVRWHNAAGERHRTDGPAVEWADGSREWWLNDKRHRTDGPAIEWANGDCEWWLNDKLHRTDGPAVEWANGGREWWINGIELNPTVASFVENGLISLNDFLHRSAEKVLTDH